VQNIPVWTTTYLHTAHHFQNALPETLAKIVAIAEAADKEVFKFPRARSSRIPCDGANGCNVQRTEGGSSGGSDSVVRIHMQKCNAVSDVHNNPPSNGSDGEGTKDEKREKRKKAKKEAKANARAKRGGELTLNGSVIDSGSKACDGCDAAVDLLIRCQIDASKRWCMLCGEYRTQCLFSLVKC
jgi:hypothetical protein